MAINTINSATLPLALLLLLSSLSSSVSAQSFDNGEVQRFYAGDTIMYRYKDEHGNIVIQDTPPPGYIDPNREHNEVIETESSTPTLTIKTKPVAKVKTHSKWLPLGLWLSSVLFILGALYIWGQPRLQRFRNETALDRSLRHANYTAFNDIVVSDPAIGQTEIDRIVRTPSGFLVLIVSNLEGSITGQPDQKEWRLSKSHDVSMVVNPLYRLDQSLRIVKSVLGNVPVFGRVVESGKATFANSMPSTVQKLPHFKQALPSFTQKPVDQKTLDASWRLLMRFPRSNTLSIKYYREGLIGWFQKNSRKIAAGGLALVGVVVAAANVFVVT